ncbi:MAG TPA: ABC transporter ATP-binding protein [Acidimicrobiales bacterium]|nr:ABC transporter ATP-binding protein [Acidimicrobiales bacterium]
MSIVTTQPRYLLDDVSRVYKTGGGDVRAVDGITLSIAPGEFIAIEGPSGSGKSTLLQLIGGLERATSGRVELDGEDLGTLGDTELTALRNKAIGFVFQHFNLIPTLTAVDNVALALAPSGVSKQERLARSTSMLQQVGLGDRLDHLPSTLSGGEQQRVAIARALVNRPRVLLADEPTGNLDTATTNEIVEILGTLGEDEVTVVLITHAVEVAERAKRRVALRDGKIVSDSASS